METLVNYIDSHNLTDLFAIKDELTAELSKGKAKADANRALYDEYHDKVVDVLSKASAPVTAQEIADETGIAHSEMKADGSVKVYIEKPIEGGFQHATCYLPSYRWEEIKGFTDQEVQKLERLLQNNAHLILQFAREGGFENASSF